MSQPGIGFRAFIDDDFVVTAPLRCDVASLPASATRDALPLEHPS